MGLTKDWRVSHDVHRVAEIGLARNFECHAGEQSAGRHRSECLGGSESAPFAPSALATFLLARSRRAANAIPQPPGHPVSASLLLQSCPQPLFPFQPTARWFEIDFSFSREDRSLRKGVEPGQAVGVRGGTHWLRTRDQERQGRAAMGGGGNAGPDVVHQVMVRTALDGPREWSMLEFQGVMEMREEGAEVDGATIGEITCKEDKKHVTLLVGNQRLDGKVTELKQPFAVMSKRRLAPPAGNDDGMEDQAEDGEKPTGEIEMEIVGFITRKIVFVHRPTVVTASWKSPTKDLGSQAVH